MPTLVIERLVYKAPVCLLSEIINGVYVEWIIAWPFQKRSFSSTGVLAACWNVSVEPML